MAERRKVNYSEARGAALQTRELSRAELDEIKRELGVVKKLRRLVEALPDDMKPEEVEAVLKGFVEEIKKVFSKDKVIKAEEINRLDKARLQKDGPKNALQRIYFLQKDAEVFFIGYILRLVEGLIKKNRRVNECGRTTEKILAELKRSCGVEINKEKIKIIIFSAFDIALKLEPEEFNSLVNKEEGVEWQALIYEGDPFIILPQKNISNNGDDLSLKHEQTHNRTDDPGYVVEYSSEQIKKIKSRIKRTKDGAREEGALLQYLKKELRVDEEVDSLKNEVVAAIEEVVKKNNFKDYTSVRAEYHVMVNELEEIARDCKFEEARVFLSSFLDNFKRRYASMLGNIKIAVAIARGLSDTQALVTVESLLQVLKPTEYWKIKEVLKDEYGKEKVEKVERNWVINQSMNRVKARLEAALKQR